MTATSDQIAKAWPIVAASSFGVLLGLNQTADFGLVKDVGWWVAGISVIAGMVLGRRAYLLVLVATVAYTLVFFIHASQASDPNSEDQRSVGLLLLIALPLVFGSLVAVGSGIRWLWKSRSSDDARFWG